MANSTLNRVLRKSLGSGPFETSYLEAGSGKPLLLLHDGAPGADSASGWNGAIEAFSGSSRKVLAIDTLGFGHSACPSPQGFEYSQRARSRQVIGFIEAAGIAPADIVANSMGGITALEVAATRPDLVGKLVLTAPAGVKSAIPEAAAPLLAYQGSREQMHEVFAALGAPGFSPDEAVVEYRTASWCEPFRQRAWQAAMEWIGQQGGLFLEDEVIASVKAEVLVIAGKSDPLIPPAVAARFPQLIERCSCHLAAGCGHWLVMERPKLLLELSNSFFGGRLS